MLGQRNPLTDRRNEVRAARNRIKEILRDYGCHIELGKDVIAGPVFYLCPNEPHDIWLDDDLQADTWANKQK